MVGGVNKHKGLRSARRQKKNQGALKRRHTIRNKEYRLKRHIIRHPFDLTAIRALSKWQGEY